LRNDERERDGEGGLMVSASRMGLLDSFGLHWAECASNVFITTYFVLLLVKEQEIKSHKNGIQRPMSVITE